MSDQVLLRISFGIASLIFELVLFVLLMLQCMGKLELHRAIPFFMTETAVLMLVVFHLILQRKGIRWLICFPLCAGADLLIYPTAIGWDVRQNEHDNREQYDAWQTIQRSHAVANGVPVVSVNRTGLEGGMQFWGGSFITNAFGRVLYQAPHLEEALHIEELDLDETDHYRRHWPYLRDRRIDSYGDITQRYID